MHLHLAELYVCQIELFWGHLFFPHLPRQLPMPFGQSEDCPSLRQQELHLSFLIPLYCEIYVAARSDINLALQTSFCRRNASRSSRINLCSNIQRARPSFEQCFGLMMVIASI